MCASHILSKNKSFQILFSPDYLYSFTFERFTLEKLMIYEDKVTYAYTLNINLNETTNIRKQNETIYSSRYIITLFIIL